VDDVTDRDRATTNGALADEEPTLSDAVESVVAASMEVVERRLELLALELRDAGVRLGSGVGLFTAAAILLVAAWLGTMGAAWVALRPSASPLVLIGGGAALNGALGLACALGARRLVRGRRRGGGP
jgi:hypothetical protein